MTQREFETIYTSVKADLMRLTRRFCVSASVDLDAEDMVQEALTAFWELSERGYPVSNPKALLVTITKNICISRYRRKQSRTEPISGDDIPGGESASYRADKSDEETIKKRLYDALTKTERMYMLMKTEDGLTLNEMAQKTGSSKAGIKTAISKAKRKLEAQFKKLGYGK